MNKFVWIFRIILDVFKLKIIKKKFFDLKNPTLVQIKWQKMILFINVDELLKKKFGLQHVNCST